MAQRRVLIALRLTYLLLLATAALLPFVGDLTRASEEVVVSDYAGAFVLLVGLGAVVVLADVLTPNKRLANVIAIYFGIVVGLVSAALSGLIDLAANVVPDHSPVAGVFADGQTGTGNHLLLPRRLHCSGHKRRFSNCLALRGVQPKGEGESTACGGHVGTD